VISVKAGGTGLNLTEACHVVHFDRWWNPAIEDQATDRAFRIGQKQNVLVHKFVTSGTLEERIDDLIQSKKSISKEIFDKAGEINLTEMSDDQLLQFISLDLNKATSN
jgi:non-specific serine/threonine protein kinase